ncbi:ABC transporter substrate-binding protein [Deinococcus sp.]|uniref:ABC transporter substrate-binding protein n=1 Tax=Deinococcus sp. TaxID=47478 RepID=UPI0025FE9ED1|nr:ABC transporter substrate-binding protein [Deinococcus sp.]
MKRALLTLSALSLLVSVAQARTWEQIKAAGSIKIATEGAFPPFNVLTGKVLSGFEVDLAQELASKLGVKYEWVTAPFDGLLIGLQQDRYDFVIASHGITPERLKAVDFSSPHYCTGGAIVSKVGGPKTAADLKGKIVAVQVGTTYLENVQKLPGVKSLVYPKDTDAQIALTTGRAAAWVGDKFTGIDLVKAQKGKLVQGELLFSEKVAMAVKKGNTSLVTQLNGALAKALADGSYAALSKKTFGQDIRCK